MNDIVRFTKGNKNDFIARNNSGKIILSKNRIRKEGYYKITDSEETEKYILANTKRIPYDYYPEIDYDELDSISIPDLNNIRYILSTDSITGAHNNVYRDHYILPRFAEEEAPFKVILAESLGIKILNSISSHSSTDLKIKSTFDSLINNLNEVVPKESNIRTFPIHSGGGTFEIIVKNDYNWNHRQMIT